MPTRHSEAKRVTVGVSEVTVRRRVGEPTTVSAVATGAVSSATDCPGSAAIWYVEMSGAY